MALDWKEQVIDPIVSFLNGDHKTIYDNCQKLLREEEDNFEYLESDDVSSLTTLVSADHPYTGDTMRQAKALETTITKQVNALLSKERSEAVAKLAPLRAKLEKAGADAGLDAEKLAPVLSRLTRVEERIGETRHIAAMRESVSTFETFTYPQLVASISDLARGVKDGDPPPPPVETLMVKQINPKFDGTMLKNEADVEKYLQSLRSEMLEALRANKRLTV